MKKNVKFSTLGTLAAAALAVSLAAPTSATTGVVLYDNAVPPAAPGGLSTGSTTNSGVPAPAGTTWSEVQADAGNTTQSNTVAGYAINADSTSPTGGFRLADNFTVPAGQTWNVERINVYAYTTGGAPAPPSIDQVRMQIWDGRPGDPGSSVIFGDLTTNRLIVAENSMMFRIFNTTTPAPGTAPGTTRIIWRVQTSLLSGVTSGSPLTLAAGTYWFDFQTSNITNTAHFSPSVTVVGARTTAGANARQFVGPVPGSWVDVIDAGNPATAPDFPQDLPFQVIGRSSGGPSCLGDIVGGDNNVNIDDLFAVINSWGACPAPCPPSCPADIAPAGGNCTVNIDDLFAVINAWGPCPP